jgi:hypothetical protein
MCMEATPGISLYSYPYLKLAKTLCLSYYCLCLLYHKIGEEGRTGSAWKQGGCREGGQGGEMAQTMYAHLNKWIKNFKTKARSDKVKEWARNITLLNFQLFLLGVRGPWMPKLLQWILLKSNAKKWKKSSATIYWEPVNIQAPCLYFLFLTAR